ncbi:MAG: carboxypeptidase regulatory-like domain-containing protein [Kiritimatiellae bacterium]|nr:carboxypeptidase regulatory-like domain-containing protein [Kiritimatiellia bacterium]
MTVTLELSPGADIELNRNFSGRLSVNGRNKGEDAEQTFLTVPMTFMAVSEGTGGVRIDCVDDATYNLESAPHLEGAHVKITNPYTGAVVAEGDSGADGLFAADGIPEGTYQLVVTAAKHGSYAAAVDVNPGRTTKVTAFLQYQAITANWTVTRTEIEDQYQVDLVLDFETSVPVPVVKMDFMDKVPDLQPGESYATKAVFTNLGLIRADDVSFELPAYYGYVWIYPAGSFSLAAGAARAVPVVLYRLPYSIEEDYASYVADTGHSGGTSSGMPHSAIASALGDDAASPSMSAFVAAVYGGAGMEVVQPTRAGSGTSSSHAGPLNPGEKDANPCTGYASYVYSYECKGDRYVPVSRQLVYDDNCPRTDAPGVDLSRTGKPGSEPSRGEEQQLNIPPGMNGGDFWVFEDGCNGGVRNKLLPCLKDLAKAGMDLELMMYGKVIPGFDGGVEAAEFCDHFNAEMQKIGDFCNDIINGNLPVEEQLNIIAQVVENGADLLEKTGSKEGNPAYGDVQTAVKVLKVLTDSWDEITSPDMSDGDRALKILETAKEVLDTLPESVPGAALGKLADHINAIKEVDKKFDGVKKNCLPLMNGSGLPGSQFLLSSPRRSPTTADTVAGDGPKNISSLREGAFVYAMDFEKATANFLIEILGSDEAWLQAAYEELSTFLGACREAIGAGGTLDADNVKGFKPSNVSDAQVETFVSRWNNMIAVQQTDGDPYADTGAAGLVRTDVLAAWLGRIEAANSYAANEADDASFTIGRLFSSVMLKWLEDIRNETESDSSAVCAKVSLKLSQTYTMTREAFEGTLALYNGHESAAMTNVWLELQITNAEGDNCNGLFEISAKSGGALEANGSNVVRVNDVAAKNEGTAVVQFVPAIAAAPETPVAYKFGGKVHYRDPFSGEEATISLIPVTLEVNPMPQLYLDYFVQRDVYADNPFTKDIVEASMPAELAVLVRNEGYGDAKDVKIESVQPEVVENEKGLMVDFRLSDYTLDAAALNGATAGLGLSDVSLGTVAARTSSVAQWWLTSTIQGHFTGMRASVTHLNSQGIVDTSLIRAVDVHALVRSVDVGDELPSFLTADGSRYGNPDRLYRADGEVLDVRSDATATTADSVRGAQCTVTVTASIPGSGPFYAKVALPGSEEYEVVGLARVGGVKLPVRNAWITDRTFVDGADPKVETFLHVFDVASTSGAKSYTVTLRAKPTDAPEVTGFEGVTADALVTNPVDRIVVSFTKAIDPATFTEDDLTVRWQGVLTNGVVSSIEPVEGDLSRYELAFARGFAAQEGRFIVQVFSSGVTSLSGTLGKSAGRQTGWTYYEVDRPAVVSVRGWLDGSTVNSVAAVTVQFAAAIDPASFTYQAIKVDGVAIGDDVVTITALNKANTSFRVTGLDGATIPKRGPNDHTIEIDTSLIRNADGVHGAAKFTSTVTIDANAPTATLTDDGEVFGSRKWTLEFSKPVVASSVSASALSLTRDGVAVAIPATARLTQVSDTAWTVSGLDAALSEDGAYALSFDVSQMTDASGNTGAGAAATSEWNYSSRPPALIDDLAFTPDWGTNATDCVTWQRNVTISGTLTNGAYSVEILARDAAGGETVLVETFCPEAETSFEKGAVLPIGRGTIIVRCANPSGKTSDSEKEFFVDAIPVSFEFVGFPEGGDGKLTNDVMLVFSEPVTNVTAECFSIRSGVRRQIDVPTGALTITPDASNLVWTVAGIDALTASGGTYTVAFDLSRVEKLSSGLHGEFDEEAHSVSWHYTPPDTTPPELVKIVFDGEEAYGPSGGISVASNGASQVKFVFSEPMNFSSLKSGGWLGRALRMQLLDDGGSVTGEVALAASQFRWRSGENAIVWTRGERALPAGRVRFFLDAGLLTDNAGNPLVGNSELDSFIRFSKREWLFAADGQFAAPANFDGQLVVGVKKNGAGEAYHYGFDGAKGACVVDGVAASNCLGVSVAKIGSDIYCGTYDGKVYKNGTLLEGVNAGRERAVLSVWNGDLVIGGDDGKLMRLDGSALEDLFGEDLVVDSHSPRRSAAAFSAGWKYEGRPLMVVGRGKGGLALYVGDGEGRWDGVKVRSVAGSASTNLHERTRPVAIDVNGDGLDDLVTGYADGTVDVRYASVDKAFVYEFEALPFHTLEEALDTDESAPELIWKTTAEAPWLAQAGESPYGGDYAVSATSMQGSALEAVVVGPGTLSFHWKKGGVGGAYCVKTNGVEALSCGAAEWGAASFAVGSGLVKVSFVAANGAVGHLDRVEWTKDASASDDEQALRAEKAAYDPDFAAFMETYGGVDPATATAGDYLRAMTNETGKAGADGKSLTLLDEFVAGTDPTDPDDVLYATIAIEDGTVYVGWVPDLNEGGQSRRLYKVWGRRDLSEGSWSAEPLSDEQINGGEYRFFRVTVQMP